MGGFLIGVFVFLTMIIISVILSMWSIFKKAGEPGWAAIVPFYSLFVLVRIVKRPLWWVILLLVPILNILVMFLIYSDLSAHFGKKPQFAVGIFFLPFIFLPIIAFDDSHYNNEKVTITNSEQSALLLWFIIPLAAILTLMFVNINHNAVAPMTKLDGKIPLKELEQVKQEDHKPAADTTVHAAEGDKHDNEKVEEKKVVVEAAPSVAPAHKAH